MKHLALFALGLLIVPCGLAQTADPMRPPPERVAELSPPENSLAAALLAAQRGDLEVTELVKVIKAQQARVAAVLEANNMEDAEALQQVQSAEKRGGSLVLRSETGERMLSPSPLVRKTPRPIGSAPSDATDDSRKPR
jgi:hypothetical protein